MPVVRRTGMFHLRFNHVFFGLMALSFLSAFIVSPKVTDRPRAHVGAIFAPVARPVNAIAGWARAKLVPDNVRDDGSPRLPRSHAEMIEENQRLRIQVANLRSVVARLQE